ncbi:MAG: hypothetical protein ACKOEX_09700 [Planctomycetia bacterium]
MTCFAAAMSIVARAGDDDPMRFIRVHVPRDAIGQVDVGGDRYVPMSVRDFEEAIAVLQGRSDADADTPFPTTAPLLDVVRYEAAVVAGSSTLEGTATLTINAATATLPLGGLAVRRARMETAAGTGDALVHGHADGSLAIAAAGPGKYVCQWRCGVDQPADRHQAIELPLVPSLASVIDLRLPLGMRPIVAGAVVTQRGDEQAFARDEQAFDRSQTWRIEVGPRPSIRIDLLPAVAGRVAPRLTSWTSIAIVGRQAGVKMVVEPDMPWSPSAGADEGVEFTLLKDPDMVVTVVRLHEPAVAAAAEPAWTVSDDGGAVRVRVPVACIGLDQAFVVEAVAPFSDESGETLPMFRVADRSWAGGGIVVNVDPAQVVSDIRVEQAALVTSDAAADWPVPPCEKATPTSVEPARIFLEHQGPQPVVRIADPPTTADMSVHRVTVAEVSPDAVLARATCDIRVQQGEAFELQGSLTPGWFIDAVEVLDAPVRPPLVAGAIDAVTETPEWRVVSGDAEKRLRIAFASAITPDRPILLRVTGHRGGVASGTPFTAAEIDMVRFDGEAKDAVLAVKTGAEMTIDSPTDLQPVVVDDPRLAFLVEDSAIRVRVPAGSRGADQLLRLSRRRPPLDVSTQVRLTSRDGRLVESFTFACSPDRTEIDSIVVHFSTVMDDRLEWSLLPPAEGTLIARRIEPPERRGAPTGEPIADTWVVELAPAAKHPVTIRAACTVAFTGPMPVPLAWVEGATRQHGTLTIRESGRFRPRVINHRLTELPPRDEATDQAFATVAEFSFDARRKDATDMEPAAEIVPGGGVAGEDARAWAWREESIIWCQASGATEYETRFDIENHGRTAVSFTVPQGLTLQGALVDGTLVPWAARGTGGGDVAIELPPGRRSIELVVRAVVRRPAGSGWWEVGTQGGTLDVPVLERNVRVLLAPDVEIAWGSPAHRVVSDESQWLEDWPHRLFHASPRGTRGRTEAASSISGTASDTGRRSTGTSSISDGTRGYRLVPVGGRRDAGTLTLVDGRFVRSTAILAAAGALAVTCLAGSAVSWLVPCLCIASAMGALWMVHPFDVIFRGAWLGTLGGMALTSGLLGSFHRIATAACILAMILLSPTATAADGSTPDLLRVFITPSDDPGDGRETALVPEPLFRRLARAAARPADARVLSCRVTTSPSPSSMATDPWTMTIDVDADAGTILVLDQRETGARMLDARVDDQQVPLRGADPVARIPLGSAGRHRVECRVAPAVVRRGQVDVATLAVPVAPRASLTVADPMGAMAGCDMALVGGPFLPAAPASEQSPSAGHFDTSRAAVVRVVRPIDSRLRLAAGVRAASSRNDLFWDLDACRATARFDIDLPNEIVRSFTVRVDPARGSDRGDAAWHCEPADDADVDVLDLGHGRYLVERHAPEAGSFSIRLQCRRPLPAPVGVFPVPGIWIEGVIADSRLTQLVPAADLVVDVRLPDNATAAPREAESSLQSVAWRTETMPPIDARDGGSLEPLRRTSGGGVVTVRRRPVDLRATQRLVVDFTADQIVMDLQARIDGSTTPLAAFTIDVPESSIIDRIELFEDRVLGIETGTARRVDTCWSRIEPGQVRVVAQQPRTGRFRLEASARVPSQDSARGTVAVMQVAVPGIVPMVVDWTSRDGRGIAVVGSLSESEREDPRRPFVGERLSSGTLELAAGDVALRYERGELPERVPAVADPPSPEDETAAGPGVVGDPVGERVELADVSLMLDQRGRCWGSVRFDVIATSSPLRIAIPTGMRLFEVLVDGHQSAMLPRDDGTWDIPLAATGWPRSVLAVFAGDVGPGVGDDRPVELDAPWLIGMPCRRVLWTIASPDGGVLRVADPARVLDADDMAAVRRAAFAGLADGFARALETADAEDRQRFEEFMVMRRKGRPLTVERAWIPGREADQYEKKFLALVEMSPDGSAKPGLTVRVGRRVDPTAARRAVATLVVVFLVGLAWSGSRRWPDRWKQVRFRAIPVAAMVAGVAWLLLLEPAWPGVTMLVAGAAWSVVRATGRRARHDADESTITQFSPPADIVMRDIPSTRRIDVLPQ